LSGAPYLTLPSRWTPHEAASTAQATFISPQPDTSLDCETTDTGLVHCAVCLFTS